MKQSFIDIYVKKIHGEVMECDSCHGSGLLQYSEKFTKCDDCNGKGFKVLNEKE